MWAEAVHSEFALRAPRVLICRVESHISKSNDALGKKLAEPGPELGSRFSSC